MRTQKEISLLSDEQKGVISQIGTTAQGSIQETFQQLAASNPELAQILQPLAPLIPGIGNALNKVGQGLVDALRTDTRNMYAGAVTLTQPIFMGGKIVAYNKITQYAEQLAESQHATGMQDIILNTDQAYWQVISLINKKKLAQSYLQLVSQLDSDVDKMITRIQVDGGVSPKTAHIVAEAGADVLVAGSAVYGAENPAQAIDDIRTKAEAAFKA